MPFQKSCCNYCAKQHRGMGRTAPENFNRNVLRTNRNCIRIFPLLKKTFALGSKSINAANIPRSTEPLFTIRSSLFVLHYSLFTLHYVQSKIHDPQFTIQNPKSTIAPAALIPAPSLPCATVPSTAVHNRVPDETHPPVSALRRRRLCAVC
jgi:hypothetical protein